MHKGEKENLELRGWVALSLIAVILGGWGCAPTAVSHIGRIAQPQLGKYDEVIVGDIKGVILTLESKQRFSHKVLSKLMELGAFRSVTLASSVPGSKSSQITLTGDITKLSEGSRAMQFLIGFGAGASKAEGVFKLINPDGKVLYQFLASTSYAGGLGIGGASFLSIDDLLDRLASSVAEQTTKFIRGEPLQEESDTEKND